MWHGANGFLLFLLNMSIYCSFFFTFNFDDKFERKTQYSDIKVKFQYYASKSILIKISD